MILTYPSKVPHRPEKSPEVKQANLFPDAFLTSMKIEGFSLVCLNITVKICLPSQMNNILGYYLWVSTAISAYK